MCPSEDPGHDISGDYIYESCRLASLIILRIIDTSLPILEAVKDTGLPSQIKASLRRTDIGSAWGDMNGCLFWASVIGAAAARQSPEWPYLAAVFVRLMFEMAYRNRCWAAAISPVKKFIWLQMTCESGKIASFSAVDPKDSFIVEARPTAIAGRHESYYPIDILPPSLRSEARPRWSTGCPLIVYPSPEQQRVDTTLE